MKTKTIFFILIFVCCGTNVFGQANNWQWGRTAICDSLDTYGNAVATDNSGNIYITGGFYSSPISFGSFSLTNFGGTDVYVAKYDSLGNVLWAKSAGGTGYDFAFGIATDEAGNIYITGYFSSPTLTFGTITLSNSGSRNIFLAKYDSMGNVIWAKKYGGANSDYGNSVATDTSGNVFVCGDFSSPTISFGSITLTNSSSTLYADIFLAKYDSSGNVLWAKSMAAMNYTSTSIEGLTNDVAVNPITGNIYVTGHFEPSVMTLGTYSLVNVNPPFGDFFLAKYDSTGNVVWAKSTGGFYNDDGVSVVTDTSENIYVTGCFTSAPITFGSYTLANGGGQDFFIAKYDSSGNVQWAKGAGGIGSDIGYSLAIESNGNVIVAGGFGENNASPITFDYYFLPYPIGANDPMFIVKYDNAGNVLYASDLESGGYYWKGVATDIFDNIYFTSNYKSDLFIVGMDTLPPSYYGARIFLAKYKRSNGVVLDKSEKDYPQRINISPNPFITTTTIQFTTTPQNAELNIYNLYGQEIKTIKNISSNKIEIDRENLSSGIYFVRLVERNGVIGAGKIIVTD